MFREEDQRNEKGEEGGQEYQHQNCYDHRAISFWRDMNQQANWHVCCRFAHQSNRSSV
jgi:hypothetical protein